MSFKTEKGISIPPVKKAGGRIAKYPFRTMGDGESFLVLPSPDLKNPMGSMKGLVSVYNQKLAPKKFVIRSMDGGVRIFRVA